MNAPLVLLKSDFRAAMRHLPDASADLIFTDPPYDRKSVPLYADLARHPCGC